MRYILVHQSSGRIDGHGVAAALGEVTPRPGIEIVESDVGEHGTHWYDGDNVIEYSEAAKTALANPPGAGFEWSPAAGQWIDQRPLSQAKNDAWARIKARRETAFAARAVSSAGIAYSITKDKGVLGDRIKSLEAAIQIGMATSSTTAIWRDLDDAEHPLSIVGYYALAAEMGVRGQAIYENSWALDAKVQAATSNAQLAAIDYDGGWP